MSEVGRTTETTELRCSVLGATVLRKFGKIEVTPISESAVDEHVAPWVSAGWRLQGTQAVPRPDVRQGDVVTDLYFFWER